MNLKTSIRRFWNDEEGATAVEYAIMVGFIAAAIITSVALLGSSVNTFFADFKELLFP